MSEEIKEEIKEQSVQEHETQEQEINEDKDLEQLVSKLEEDLKASEDKYLRVHADFENIKKRLEKEKYQAIDYASEKFAKDLLTPIDTLEMALQSAQADLEPEELLQKLKEGIELTLKNFVTVFEKHDISIVQTDDEFDPNLHDAVMQVDSNEHNDGQIVQVMQKGYTIKERLLRPAMVSICKK